MFERFTTEARDVVVAAQVEARGLGHRRIGTEHLLLGLLADAATLGGTILAACDLTLDATRQYVLDLLGCRYDPTQDVAALEAIGIDLDQVRTAVEQAFGKGALERAGGGGFSQRGHIPFSPKAKKALELSLREALRLKDRHIGTEHILLALLREGEGLAALLLSQQGIDRAVVESALTERRREAS